MEVSPETLEFEAPFTDQVVRPLYLRNDSGSRLAYKIKTTAPKLYCVRPNASIIEPGTSVEVSIIRQYKDVPAPDGKSKDKFLVLSAPVDADANADNFADLWKNIPEAATDSKKIRVTYKFASEGEGEAQQPVAVTTSAAPEEPDTTTFSNTNTNNTEDAEAPANGSTGVAKSATNATQRAASTVNSEIESAQAKIAEMQKDIKASSSTSEKRAGGSSAQAQHRVRQPTGGVPVPIVLILALIAFFIGWKLF
ncbi:vesicle-associated membrane protein-associated protein Scs2p [Trichomonascus vanleenenianus]|uniref:phosphatidylinositol-binding protein SCS2 n=1 Tax=Trichomonascus vanleenenianus TaxID=2268995 RepID=UPI003EC9882D